MSCPSSIQCQNLNPWPSEHESPPITTRPGLPSKSLHFSLYVNIFVHCLNKLAIILLGRISTTGLHISAHLHSQAKKRLKVKRSAQWMIQGWINGGPACCIKLRKREKVFFVEAFFFSFFTFSTRPSIIQVTTISFSSFPSFWLIFCWCQWHKPWSSLVEGDEQPYRPHG